MSVSRTKASRKARSSWPINRDHQLKVEIFEFEAEKFAHQVHEEKMKRFRDGFGKAAAALTLFSAGAFGFGLNALATGSKTLPEKYVIGVTTAFGWGLICAIFTYMDVLGAIANLGKAKPPGWGALLTFGMALFSLLGGIFAVLIGLMDRLYPLF